MMRQVQNLVEMAQQAQTGQYEVHGDVRDADCLVGQSFGFVRNEQGIITSGLANIALARLALDQFPDLPKILQFEIADAYEERDDSGKNTVVQRIEAHRQPGKYLDTREVSEQAVAAMAQNGWSTAVVLGHPHHIPRVDSSLRRLGVKTVTVENVIGVWDRTSEQPWTRNPAAWAKREMPAIGVYAIHGWLDL